MVMELGTKSVKPSDFFMKNAQTISSKPASTRYIQAIIDPLFGVVPE
jgi:hypothetical protein